MFSRDADRLARFRTSLVEARPDVYRVDVERVGPVGFVAYSPASGWAVIRDGLIVEAGIPRRRSAVRRLLMTYDRNRIDPGAGSTARREAAAARRFAATTGRDNP